MAECAQHFVFFFVSVMLGSYLLCQHVFGMALKQPEGAYEIDSKGQPIAVEGNKFQTDSGEVIELFPVLEPHLQLEFNISRRRLSDFLGCSSCRCCDNTGNTCYYLPCCCTINCSVFPYGFCKFVPLSCDCGSCS
jgi:hypothetical protein